MIFRTITVIFPERIVLTAEHFTCLTSDCDKEKDKKVQRFTAAALTMMDGRSFQNEKIQPTEAVNQQQK